MNSNVVFQKVRNNVICPSRGTSLSAGIDFYTLDEDLRKFIKKRTLYGKLLRLIYPNKCMLAPGESILLPTGFKVKIPQNTALIGFNKSGVSTKKQLQIGACVVDEDYQGEMHIHLFNASASKVEITTNEKIAQFIVMPVHYSEIFVTKDNIFESETERGAGGFGSTNK